MSVLKYLLAVAIIIVIIYFIYSWLSSDAFENSKVLILYHAPWCGYCKKFMPTWHVVKKKYSNQLKFIEINCDDNKSLCEKHGISSYPTIRLLTKDNKVIDYAGDRSEDDLIKFISI